MSKADAIWLGNGDEWAGYAVAGAGDINADGYADMLVGVPWDDTNGDMAGAAYVILGGSGTFPALAQSEAKLLGPYWSGAGTTVAGAGDINNDGHDDIMVGAPERNEATGAVFLLYGPVTGEVELTDADARLVGKDTWVGLGLSLAAVGDVDGDGVDDLAVSDEQDEVYVMFGPVEGRVKMPDADARLIGEGNGAGDGLAGLDVNGDGLGDLVIGASSDNTNKKSAGAAYLALAPMSGYVDLSWPDAKYLGKKKWDFAGAGVDGAGDIDGDGLDDVLIGAPGVSTNGDHAGAAYLVLGWTEGELDLASVAEAEFLGERADDLAGQEVAGVGDVNGDGSNDILIGAEGESSGGGRAGAVYFVAGPVSGQIELSNATAKLLGEAPNNLAGSTISGAGDVNSDGFPDIITGAPGSWEGTIYLVFGGTL
ncbi:MAG: hypothetical protein HN348_19165 [Proteobacteria bacterium]|nr:hypothetical protein [Pseudomonadota bacterium]